MGRADLGSAAEYLHAGSRGSRSGGAAQARRVASEVCKLKSCKRVRRSKCMCILEWDLVGQCSRVEQRCGQQKQQECWAVAQARRVGAARHQQSAVTLTGGGTTTSSLPSAEIIEK